MTSVINIMPASDLSPRLLQLDWYGEGEPQHLVEKVFLKGSVDNKFLTIYHPPVTIGMNEAMLGYCLNACMFFSYNFNIYKCHEIYYILRHI